MLRLWRLSRVCGRDLRLLWFALKHRRRPLWLLPATVMLALYALEPFNFALPLVGIVDDLLILPLVLHVMLRLLPRDIHDGFDGGALV
jgi:uncharacterized membrane protein YkvA (DUF1232 family)